MIYYVTAWIMQMCSLLCMVRATMSGTMKADPLRGAYEYQGPIALQCGCSAVLILMNV